MLTTYLRSSSISTLQQCELKYYLEYILGFRFPAHISAWKGNIVHKATELLALKKKNEQNGKLDFIEDEKTYQINEITLEFAITEAIEIYKKKEPERKYETKDLQDCRDWYYKYINEYPNWTPLNRWVISSEEYFDIAIDEDWAKYKFIVNNETIEGSLAIKGTMDLLFKIDDDTYEYCDLKTTGSNKDWITGKIRDYDKIHNDVQFLLYYYALRKKYVNKNILVTPIYIRHGGPFPVCFDDNDILKLKNILQNIFDKIKQINITKNIKGDFKCGFCPFKSQKFKNDVSYCDYFDIEIKKHGVDLVSDKYLDKNYNNYGDGGGKSRKSE